MENTINDFFGNHRFLSNFWMEKISYEGIIYPSAEHAYQAAKMVDNIEYRERIARLDSPGRAKRAGRFAMLRLNWDDIKRDVMLDIIRIKFENPKLKKLLLATKDQYLQEGNNWGDTYWGVYRGQGMNILGQILMKVRRELHDGHF